MAVTIETIEASCSISKRPDLSNEIISFTYLAKQIVSFFGRWTVIHLYNYKAAHSGQCRGKEMRQRGKYMMANGNPAMLGQKVICNNLAPSKRGLSKSWPEQILARAKLGPSINWSKSSLTPNTKLAQRCETQTLAAYLNISHDGRCLKISSAQIWQPGIIKERKWGDEMRR